MSGTGYGTENAAILGVAVSSRVLFNLDDSADIFREKGMHAFVQHELKHLNDPLPPGPAFPFIKRLLAMNDGDDQVVRVSIVSGQHPATGQRIMNSVAHYGLGITQAAFTGGKSPVAYIRPMGGDIFLTRNSVDAQNAIDAGIASAILHNMPGDWFENEEDPIRIALDGDAVLFTDACEAIARKDGLGAFMENERKNLDTPLEDGPFGHFFRLLHRVRERRPGEIRLSLVTARNGIAGNRALSTLHHWGCDPDDAFMLGALSKGPVIEALRPHIFLDDGERHIKACSPHAPSGLVPYRRDGEMFSVINAA